MDLIGRKYHWNSSFQSDRSNIVLSDTVYIPYRRRWHFYLHGLQCFAIANQRRDHAAVVESGCWQCAHILTHGCLLCFVETCRRLSLNVARAEKNENEIQRKSGIALYLAKNLKPAIVYELLNLCVNEMFVSRTITLYNDTDSIMRRYGGGPKKNNYIGRYGSKSEGSNSTEFTAKCNKNGCIIEL